MDKLRINLNNEAKTAWLAQLVLQALQNISKLPSATINEASQQSTTSPINGTFANQTNLTLASEQLKAQINLRGELGAGKTSFCRSFLQNCGVKGRIKSPSYTLVETYVVSNLYLYHFDFYRFSDAQEWRDAGFDELLAQNAISLIEWPEHAGSGLPAPDLEIYLEYAGQGRRATISAYSEKGQQWLKQINNLIS